MFSNFFRRRFSKSSTSLIKSALTQFHIDNGGNMIQYAGNSFPDYYQRGPVQEHLLCKKECSLFDASFMGQYIITGSDREEFLKNIMPLSFPYEPDNSIQRSLITNDNGGIIDSCTVTSRTDNSIYLVVNGISLSKDNDHLQEQLEIFKAYEKNVDIKLLKENSLLSLQGPKSSDILNKLCNTSIAKLPYMSSVQNKIGGVKVWISRFGFTGEDGFEISIENPKDALQIAKMLVEHKEVHLAGLKARDSLRLEAGIPFYGSELDEETTPVEAGLENLISKDRREGFPPFFGGKKILAEIKDHRKARDRRLVGLLFESSDALANKGCKVFNNTGKNEIGKVTSGAVSPVLKRGIAMAYVKTIYANSKKQDNVIVEISGKKCQAVIVPMPFIRTNYYRG